jgi:hypothetical protein
MKVAMTRNKRLVHSLKELRTISDKEDTKFDYVSENFTYQCLWRPHWTGEHDRLFVLFHGAQVRTENGPYWPRWSWDFPGDVLAISDPTLDISLDEDMTITWYAGSFGEYALEKITRIVKSVAKYKNIQEKDIVFYGSSGGGFAAIAASRYIPNSLAVSINGQTDILKYYSGPGSRFQALVRNVFPGFSVQSAYEKYFERFNLVETYKPREGRILYVQDKLDTHHYENHYLPFMRRHSDSVEAVLFEDGRHGGELGNTNDEKKEWAKKNLFPRIIEMTE